MYTMYSVSLPPSIIPLLPANPPSFLQVSTHISVIPLFYDPLSLTMALFVAIGLEPLKLCGLISGYSPKTMTPPPSESLRKIVQQGGVGSAL